MKKVNKKLTIDLNYFFGKSEPEKGVFRGNVEEPLFLEELGIWVEKKEIFDFSKDEFVETKDFIVNLKGTKRAIFEFGKYLIALSEFETDDPNYHEHLDNLGKVFDKEKCEMIIYLPEPDSG